MNYYRAKKNRKGLLAEINVVPYIDVMLVLLIIFMVTAPLLTQGINVDLPKAQAKALSKKNQEPIVVSVDREGKYYLNVSKQPSDPINGQQLLSQVAAYLEIAKQQNQSRDVYVKGDRSVDYGKVVQAMVMLQEAGASNVGLITDNSSSG